MLKKTLCVLTAAAASLSLISHPASAVTDENLSEVSFIRQGAETCKASSLAMALNIITGGDNYSTYSLGNSYCKNIDGEIYYGSDGKIYTAEYKSDSYVGSYGEVVEVIEDSVSNGIPVVAAVHSTTGATKHHWVVIVGKGKDGSYLVADPYRTGYGSIDDNVKTMSALNYSLGLTDYSKTHYGYISFSRENSVSYFPKCDSSSYTIYEGLLNIGVDPSYDYREKIAAANGFVHYRGKAAQNIEMLRLLKAGLLIKP